MTTVNLAFQSCFDPPDFRPDVVVGGSNVRGGLPDTSFSALFRADAPVSSSPRQKKDVFAAFSIPCTVFEINSLQAYFFHLLVDFSDVVGELEIDETDRARCDPMVSSNKNKFKIWTMRVNLKKVTEIFRQFLENSMEYFLPMDFFYQCWT